MNVQNSSNGAYAVNYIPTNIISSGNGYSITPEIYNLQYMSLSGYYYFTLPEGLEPVQNGVPIADITLTDRYRVYEFTDTNIETITSTMTPSEVVEFYSGKLTLIYENTWENAVNYSSRNQKGRLYNFPVTNVVSFVGDQITDGVIVRPVDTNTSYSPKRYLFTVDIPKIVDNTSNKELQMSDILCDLLLTYKDGITDTSSGINWLCAQSNSLSTGDILSMHNRMLMNNAQNAWSNISPYLSVIKYLPLIRTVASFLL